MRLKDWSAPRKVFALMQRGPGVRRPKRMSHPRRRSLVLETLEDRSLPSGLTSSILEIPIHANVNSAAFTKTEFAPPSHGNSVAIFSRGNANGVSLVILTNFSFNFGGTTTQASNGNSNTSSTTTSTTGSTTASSSDASVLSTINNAHSMNQNSSNQSLQDNNNQSSTASNSSSSTSPANSTNQNTLNTTVRVSATLQFNQSIVSLSPDFLFLLANRNQQANPSDTQSVVRPATSVLAAQQITVTSPSFLSSSSRGGFGQEEYQPLPILDSPLNSFDTGVDDALRGREFIPGLDGAGVSVLDRLFREWSPTPAHSKNNTQPQSENSTSEEAQTASPAGEPKVQDHEQSNLIVVPATEDNLSSQWPLMKTSSTADEDNNPGSALAGANGLLVAQRPENAAPAAAPSAEGNEELFAGLALLVLAYPVGKELRAKQDRRSSL